MLIYIKMKLKEIFAKLNLKKIAEEYESGMQQGTGVEVHDKLAQDQLEKRISGLEARVSKAFPSRKRRAARWAGSIGLAAFIFFSGHHLAMKKANVELSSVHNDIGILYKLKGEYNKAAYQYLRSIELDSTNKYVYHNLGTLYLDVSGDYAKAEQYIKKAIELRPDYAPSHKSLGDVYFRLKRYEMAEAEYRKAVDIDPALVDAYTGLGAVCDLLGKKDDAEKYRRIAGELSNKAKR